MYKFILNPKNNKKVFTNSTLGKHIIDGFVKHLKGGTNEILSESSTDEDYNYCDEDRCQGIFIQILNDNDINDYATRVGELNLFWSLRDEELNTVRDQIEAIIDRNDMKLLREYYFDKLRNKIISFIDNSECMERDCIFRGPPREHGDNLDDLIINQFPFLNPELGDSSEGLIDNGENNQSYSEIDDESDDDDDEDSDESEDDSDEDSDESEDDSDEDSDESEDDRNENGYISDANTVNVLENSNSINIYPNNNSELVNAVNMYCSDRENAVEIFGDINSWNIVQHFDNGSMSYFDSDREQSILEQNSDSDENLLSDLRETIDNLTDVDNGSDSVESESESDNEEERMIPGQGFNIRRGREHLLEDDTVFAKWEYDDQTDKFMLMGFNIENDEWFQLNFRQIEPEGEILITRELLNMLPYGYIPSPGQVFN